MGDIIWYNDLIHPMVIGDDEYCIGNESADALFTCETFELIDLMAEGPTIIFEAFAGHSIEFRVSLYIIIMSFFS